MRHRSATDRNCQGTGRKLASDARGRVYLVVPGSRVRVRPLPPSLEHFGSPDPRPDGDAARTSTHVSCRMVPVRNGDRLYDPDEGENRVASVRPHNRAVRRYLVGSSSSGIRWATASSKLREASRTCTRIRTAWRSPGSRLRRRRFASSASRRSSSTRRPAICNDSSLAE
jgi:hypothetical protein